MTALPTFSRRFLDALPGDPETAIRPRPVPNALWSRVAPTPVQAPRLLAYSRRLCAELGLSEDLMGDPATAAVFGGNALWPGMEPYAANYGGHQFGSWAGQLGDGRAIVLGELVTPSGAVQELQLKGAGPTPYSRRGDGRAVLRSSIREFLCSEAMWALGVPTTRALTLVATGDSVWRDMFYDGRPKEEPGAIVCRVAPSFLRFGSFELPSSRGETALLQQLLEFALRQYFPAITKRGREGIEALLLEVTARTARLIAHWQAVGFVHGVMNTDNLSLLGLTIDYGPYGWIEDFDPSWTPNTTDAGQRRYAFGNQPGIGLWNLKRLSEALLPLCDEDETLTTAVAEHYTQEYSKSATAHFRQKIGLESTVEAGDESLLRDLFAWMVAARVDMTLFFRALGSSLESEAAPEALPTSLRATLYGEMTPELEQSGVEWLQRHWRRIHGQSRPLHETVAAMAACNPKYVLRNWLAQEAIEAAEQEDLSKLERLMTVLERPYDEQREHEALAQKRPDWAFNKPGCSALSCSS